MSKKRHSHLFILLMIIILTACQSASDDPKAPAATSTPHLMPTSTTLPDNAITPLNTSALVEKARFDKGSAEAVYWSADSQTVLIGSSLGVWKYNSANLSADPVFIEGYQAITISPTSDQFTTGNHDELYIWDTHRNEKRLTLTISEPIRATYNRDSSRLAVANRAGEVTIWDTDNGTLIATYAIAEQSTSSQMLFIRALAYNQDDTLLAIKTVFNTPQLSVWDVENEQEIATLTNLSDKRSETPQETNVTLTAFNPSADRVIFVDAHGSIKFWNFVTDETGIALNGSWFASKSDSFLLFGDGTEIKLFDVALQEITRLKTPAQDQVLSRYWHITDAAFNPDHTRLLLILNGIPTLYDLSSNEAILTLDTYFMGIKSLASQDQQLAFIDDAPNDYTIYFWDTVTQTLTHTWEMEHAQNLVAFHPTRPILASSDNLGRIQLWDSSSGELLDTLSGFDNIHALSFSPDGRYLAYAASFGDYPNYSYRLRVLDLDTHQPLIEDISLDLTLNSRSFLKITPNGDLLIFANSELADIKFWDLNTGQYAKTLTANRPVTALTLSPNGQFLAAGGENRLEVWELNSYTSHKFFRGFTGTIQSIDFNATNDLLATALDHTISLWDINTAATQPLLTLQNDNSYTQAVYFSNDGTALFSTGLDGTLRIWAID